MTEADLSQPLSNSGRVVTERAAMMAWRLVEYVPQPLAVSDPDGLLIMANRAFANLVGQRQNQLLRGARLHEVLPGVTAIGLEPGDHSLRTLTVLTPRGPEPMTVLVARAGDEIHIVVQETNEADTQRRERDQTMAAVANLAAGVAHDFNNQLAGITGYAGLLRRKSDDTNAHHYADRILAVSQQATATTQRLVAFAGCSRQPTKPVFVHDLLSEITTQLKQTAALGVTLQPELRARHHVVQADRGLLRNALQAVIANAIEAIDDEQGQVLIRTSDSEAPLRGVTVSIVDNGHGMSPAVQARALEPYFTTRARGAGAGMGLAAAWGTIKEYGGQLTLASAPDAGTTVTITLPADIDGASSGRLTAAGTAADGTVRPTGTVLVIDDEAAVRETYAESMQAVGFTVEACATAQAAWSVFAQAPEAIDLVIVDRSLPDENGASLLGRMRGLRPRLPAVLVSGYAFAGDGIEDALTASLQKPISLNRLESVVARLMRQARDSAAS